MSKAITRSVLKEVQDFRDCVKRVVAMLSGKQIPVAERGNEAYVRYNRRGEPVLVNIPSIPDDASPTLMNAVRGFLDHEVAHSHQIDVTQRLNFFGDGSQMLMEPVACSTWRPVAHNQHDLLVLHSPCKQSRQLRDALTIDVIEQGECLTHAAHAGADLWRVGFLIPVFDNGQH